jgi:uncharacterized protein
MENVLILGASDKPERYSHKAKVLLEEHGHKTFLVHPKLKEVDGVQVFASISKVESKIDTLTMYINPGISLTMIDEIIRLNPKRVIFNPGTENAELVDALNRANICSEEACTLVLLNTGQF